MQPYIALIRKEEDTSYGVDFPDFPGCVSGGESLQEALMNARGALSLHIEGMIDDGEDIPAPSPLDEVMKSRHNKDATAALVQPPPITPKSVRVNVLIEQSLLNEIDHAVAEIGSNRSAFIAQSARSLLQSEDLLTTVPPMKRSITKKSTAARSKKVSKVTSGSS